MPEKEKEGKKRKRNAGKEKNNKIIYEEEKIRKKN